MSTYSIGQSPTDADKLEDLGSVLLGIPDNTQKLITPKNVRNAIFTTWENITFKLTNNNGGTSYIGIDRSDIKSKILIGKKEKVTGQGVLNSDLLASDVDIFFFNTKSSTQSSSTKIAFLAGTNSYFSQSQLRVPYIESSVVGDDLNLNIVNQSGTSSGGGSINIESNSYVTINGLFMPTKVQNSNPSNDGYVLKYSWIGGNAYGIWGTVSSSGQTASSETFTDNTPVTTQIGGIKVGETFNNVPLTTMIRKLIYQYIKPTMEISLTSNIIEVGDTPTTNLLRLNWTITRTSTQSLLNPTFNPNIQNAPIGNQIQQGSTFGSNLLQINQVPQADNNWRIVTFTASVSDNVDTSTASTSLLFTIPWYYGTSTISTTQSITQILGTNSFTTGRLIPLLTNPATQSSEIHNKSLSITTFGLNNSQGYVYFGYPNNFVDLVDIKDNNGYSVFTSFRKFTIGNVASPQSRWTGRTYSFWILTGSTVSVVPQLTTIDPGSPFQFLFATQS